MYGREKEIVEGKLDKKKEESQEERREKESERERERIREREEMYSRGGFVYGREKDGGEGVKREDEEGGGKKCSLKHFQYGKVKNISLFSVCFLFSLSHLFLSSPTGERKVGKRKK